MELHHILSRSGTNLRQPVDLEEQLLQDRCMGSDVGESMLQMLQVSQMSCAAASQLSLPCAGVCKCPKYNGADP